MMTRLVFNRRTLCAYILASLLFGLSQAPAAADCGTGSPATYDDITGIEFERYECDAPPQGSKSVCSSYQVFISNWDHHQRDDREYEQFAPRSEAGSYTLNVSATGLIEILRQYKFFELNPANIGMSDTPYTVLTVKHCSTVTRISQPAKYVRLNGFELDRATQALFDALNVFIEKAPKLRVSGKPQHRETNWDGWF